MGMQLIDFTRTWLRAVLFTFACVLATGVVAHAQDTDAAAPAGDSAATSDAFARKIFAAGKAAYEIGNYQEALKYFQQAYELSGRSQLLYNVGQAADRLRYDETALAALKRYLAEQPEAENRQEVQERIRVLQGVIEAKQAQDGAQPSAAEVTVPSPALVAEAAQPKSEPAVAPSDTDRDEPGLLSQWWLWAGAGAAVAVVVVTVLVVGGGTEHKTRDPYAGSNGNVTATLQVGLP